MTFPSIEQYIDALQIPQHTLLAPRLAAGRVEATKLGLPFGRSGQFALTFKIIADGRAYAFRCFQSDRASMRERYNAISTAVRAANLPYFVAFEYLAPGIRVQQQDYPALSMDWAQGPPLGVYVEQHYRDPGRLRAVLQQLHGMALALEGAGIAHGDIQTGNILVGPAGELKLVDYDGMYVPALTSLGAIETGHPNFQHPQRARLKPFDGALDRFSFALLHATLTALIESPSLWTTLNSDPEALLLRATDLANPTTTEAFRVLTRLPSSGPTFMRLLAVTSADYAQIPTFSDFLAGRNIPQVHLPARSAVPPTGMSASTATYSSPAMVTPPARNTAALAGLTSTPAPPGRATPVGRPAASPKAPAASTRFATSTSASSTTRSEWPDWAQPTLVLLCLAALALVIILIGLLASAASNDSGGPASGGEQLTTAADASASTLDAQGAKTAAELVGTCFYATASAPTGFAQIACNNSNAQYRVSKATVAPTSCPVESVAWEDGNYLCLDTYPPVAVYQTCFKEQGFDKVCQDGLEWTYSSCWTVGQGAVLEQQINGQWKTVLQGISTKDGCMKDYSWTVEFTRKSAGPGVKNYRLYIPAADGFTSTVQPITVTVREK